MKIDPNMTVGAAAPAVGKPRARSGGDFEEILTAVQQTRNIRGEPLQGGLLTTGVNPAALAAFGASQDALDLLERYRAALEDPMLTLRELEPMVEELGAMRERLDGCASTLAEGDPLRAIVDETSRTLMGEVVRFRRGDLVG